MLNIKEEQKISTSERNTFITFDFFLGNNPNSMRLKEGSFKLNYIF